MSEEADFQPIVKFPDQSHSFVHGFEAGMIWQQMQDGADPIDPATDLHVDNVQVFENMCNTAGYEMHVKERHDDQHEWIGLSFTKRREVRGHLSVVPK